MIDIPDCDPFTDVEIAYLKGIFAVAQVDDVFAAKVREMNATCAGVHSWH